MLIVMDLLTYNRNSFLFLFSGGDAKGVHVTKLTCKDGIVTWYNPVGALRLELQPKFSARFKACFVVDSGSVRLKVSQEVDARREPKSPSDRSNYFMNDHNLQTVLATKGRSQEVCITQENKLLLYLEPEVSEFLGYQKINFLYDMVALDKSEEDAIIEGLYKAKINCNLNAGMPFDYD